MAEEDFKLLGHSVEDVSEMIQISEDFNDDNEAKFLVSERWNGGASLHYERWRRKVVYHTSAESDRAYLEFQRQAMLKHKWIMSEKAGRDVGENAAALDWLKNHAENFKRFWRRTHVFIPVKMPAFAEVPRNDYY